MSHRLPPALSCHRLPVVARWLVAGSVLLSAPLVAAQTGPDVSELFQGAFNGAFAGTEPTQAQPPTAADPRAGVPFTRSRSVTRTVERGLADSLAANFTLRFAMHDPADFLRSGKAREVATRELKARGFPEDSVAGSTALLLAVAWEIANGGTLSGEENAAILRQTTTSFRGHPLEREADEQRQLQADPRLLTVGLWLEEAYLREPFPAQKQALSDAVQRDMQTISTNDMRRKRVTDEGFVDRPS